jgi:hypothetical protein
MRKAIKHTVGEFRGKNDSKSQKYFQRFLPVFGDKNWRFFLKINIILQFLII